MQSGYSKIRLLWDTETGKQMTPKQKVCLAAARLALCCDFDHGCLCVFVCVLVQLAFLMEHVEIKDESLLHLQHEMPAETKQLKCQLRCEVEGFEHNTRYDK